ncbi:hypothetical protein FKW77_006087 [Venturia effusa]|uniref:Uncharacterized protein n=1 Tax=Venturia effusa TaxID=50376 RepID=A0A517L7I7_9PEZI|nr:hypothetical protein FKW77_006087 [Venturia effusa]
MNRLSGYFKAEQHNQLAASPNLNRFTIGAGILLTATAMGPGISYFLPVQNLNHEIQRIKKRTGMRSIFDLGLKLTQTYILPTTFGGLAVTAGIINVAWTANVISEIELEGAMKLKDAMGLIGVLGLTIWTSIEAIRWLKWAPPYQVDDEAERERERQYEMESLRRAREVEEYRIRHEQEAKMARIRAEHEAKMSKLQEEDEKKREAKREAKRAEKTSYRPAGSLSGFFESKDKEAKKEKKPRSRKAKSLML